MKQAINFMCHRTRKINFENPHVFQLRPARGKVWLQKICFYILRKIGAFYWDEKIEVEKHVIDSPSFMERIFKQKDNLSIFFDRKPARLLIGSDEYAWLMNDEIAPTAPFSFKCEYNHNENICGLRVEVIPWMSGILVMPDEVSENVDISEPSSRWLYNRTPTNGSIEYWK